MQGRSMLGRPGPNRLVVKCTIAWLAIMVIAATGATLVAASPTFAAATTNDASATCFWSLGSCGSANFTAEVSDGSEILAIWDDNADGFGVAVENYRYDLANIGPYWGWNRTPAVSVTFYTLHIAEAVRFEFRVCPEQNGVPLTDHCGAWANGYA
jgi:hypothetical protein